MPLTLYEVGEALTKRKARRAAYEALPWHRRVIALWRYRLWALPVGMGLARRHGIRHRLRVLFRGLRVPYQ